MREFAKTVFGVQTKQLINKITPFVLPKLLVSHHNQLTPYILVLQVCAEKADFFLVKRVHDLNL